MTSRALGEHLAFALAAHRALNPDATRESCLSPLSLASALGLLASGARAQTRAELATALTGAPDGELAAHARLLASATTLAESFADERPVLAVANTLWTDESVHVEPAFVEELRRWPAGAVRTAAFRPDPEPARQKINSAVAETTRGLVPELLRPGAVHANTLAALVNALYLRAGWRHAFSRGDTTPALFHTPRGTHEVPTMRQTHRMGHTATRGWTVVRLPADGGVDVDVLLPDGDLAEAERGLDARHLGALLAAVAGREVELHLPVTRVRAAFRLEQALAALGVRAAFGAAADLSGISVEPPLRVGSAAHEAVLRLDERGLEGAAATAVTFAPLSLAEPEEPVVVRVDRPFLLLVRHRDTGVVLFLARVTDPAGG
ncbi:serpin family protein [Streptoalloteichus hindustanus]|uniref:Serpin B n=1 Tax=Streptoalloteichus hindustanus TaxID=2017 RepID=A0A1M5BGU8_STRHI|nr:serpin family protein [Streptoalloteichus hindustanus]SHF41681.1 serpin B [Streptoalloteichus hindustanus]